jgi:hypothetical protein
MIGHGVRSMSGALAGKRIKGFSLDKLLVRKQIARKTSAPDAFSRSAPKLRELEQLLQAVSVCLRDWVIAPNQSTSRCVRRSKKFKAG